MFNLVAFKYQKHAKQIILNKVPKETFKINYTDFKCVAYRMI